MVLFYVLDIIVLGLMIGKVYNTDASTPFCIQSAETHPSTCCLCPANTSCDLTCPGQWEKIRGNEVQCYNEYPYDDEDNIDTNSGDSEIPMTPIGTSVYCVAECPVGTFYEHRALQCQPCDPSCKVCVGPNATGCTECEFETEDGCMKECLPGWEPILGRKGPRRGTVCKIRDADDDGKPKTVVIVVAVVGTSVAVIVVIVVIVVCWVKRSGRWKLVQTKNTREKSKRYVRRENIDVAGYLEQETPFTTGNTDVASIHEYNYIDDNAIEVKYDYASTEREGDRKKPAETEEGYEQIDGDFQNANHDIHVDEAIYEDIGVASQSKGPTPRAGQEHDLKPVALSAEKDTAYMDDRTVKVMTVDMSEEMQHYAIDCAKQAIAKYNVEHCMATYIKKEFDKKYTAPWHATVGRQFGSFVTHKTKHFIHVCIGSLEILLFKAS